MSDVASALIGVVVGGGITVAKDWVAHRTGRQRRGRFAAVRIVCVLDQYIGKCSEVVLDDGTDCGQPAGRTDGGEEYYEPQVDTPPPPAFPDGIDWTSIDPGMMYRILSLANEALQTDRYISAQAEHSFPPAYSEIFEARWEGYADLGLKALGITEELRRSFNLPKRPVYVGNPDWDVEEFFREKKAEINARRETYRARNASLLDELSASDVA